MKILFGILVILLSAKECEDKKQLQNNSNIDEMAAKVESKQEKEYAILYTAISRGLFKEVIITSENVTIKKDRTSKAISMACSKELWRAVTKNLDSINLETLHKLEAPTQKRLFDGAAHATLKISVGDDSYTTASFDHGFPPKEIEVLCNTITKLIQE